MLLVGFTRGLFDKSITSLARFFEIFLRQWHYDGNDIELFNIESFIKTNLKYFFPWRKYHVEDHEMPSINMVYNNQYSETHDDPVEVVHEESFIEDIIKDPPHVTLIDNTKDWDSFHDYFSDDDHICTLDLPQRETIT